MNTYLVLIHRFIYFRCKYILDWTDWKGNGVGLHIHKHKLYPCCFFACFRSIRLFVEILQHHEVRERSFAALKKNLIEIGEFYSLQGISLKVKHDKERAFEFGVKSRTLDFIYNWQQIRSITVKYWGTYKFRFAFHWKYYTVILLNQTVQYKTRLCKWITDIRKEGLRIGKFGLKEFSSNMMKKWTCLYRTDAANWTWNR